MPRQYLRALGIRLRRARRRVAAVDKRVLGLLLMYIALIWTLPFIFRGPRAWRLGIGRGDGFPTPKAQGELMIVSDGDKRVRNGHYHEFDLVGALDHITDHLHRFCKAQYVTMVRVLTEKVTAPVFAESYWLRPRNKTADLMGWLREDTESICFIMKWETRDTISRLSEHEELCASTDPASERPVGHTTGASSTEHTEPQDVRCSSKNVHNRDRLLRSARDLEKKVKPSCDKVHLVLRQATDDESFWARLHERIMARADGMATDLRFLYDLLFTLYRADEPLYQRQPWYLPVSPRNVGGVRLETLASRAATDHPDDLDPFTAVLLYILRETSLLDLGPHIPNDKTLFLVQWSWTDRLLLRPHGTRQIRYELEWQARIINTTSDLLASAILPRAREWSALMQAVKEADIFNTNGNGADDVSHEPKPFWEWLWSIDSDAPSRDEGRWLEAFEDGVDHLEFLRGYLVQLRHGLPGMMARLDLWDAEVTELDDELTMALTWGKKYTGRRRQRERRTQSQPAHQSSTSGSRDIAGGELDITRWQISPSTLDSVGIGLKKLELALNGHSAEFRIFDSQDSHEDNWFESGMHRWSRSMLEKPVNIRPG